MAFDLNEAVMKIMAEKPTISVDQARILARKLEPTASQAGDAWRDAMGIYGDVMSLMSPVAAGGQIRTKIADAAAPLLKQETASARDARINNELLARIPGGSGPEEYNLVPQINVPPGSTVESKLSAQQLLDQYLKTNHPVLSTVGTGSDTSDVYTDSPEYTDAQKALKDIREQMGKVTKPQFTTPNAEADLTARMRDITVPKRPGLSDLSDEDKGAAILKMGLGMMKSSSPWFAQGLAAGGEEGLAAAEKSRETMMKDLMTKYGIDADMAMKMVTARSQDTAGKNANAELTYKNDLVPLEQQVKMLEVSGKLSGQRDTAKELARYHREIRQSREAGQRALAESKRESLLAGDKVVQMLRANVVKSQLDSTPEGRAVSAQIDRAQKVSDEKDRRTVLANIFMKMGDADPALLKAAIAATTSDMSTAQVLQIIDAATKKK